MFLKGGHFTQCFDFSSFEDMNIKKKNFSHTFSHMVDNDWQSIKQSSFFSKFQI